ncbi:MAG TPA: SDR family NAD(P)-dependent oxidoreductase [Candidatus Acidoferrales bacterium]|nr:SDR family NAD(P)-dependent oxidoreductase [Candidatus Acidoferrales bacterium]
MQRLDAKVAIVTGAGQGIGRGIALVFAREGAKVAVAEIKEHRARRTAEEINNAGGEAIAIAVDVGNREQVQQMVETVLQRFSTVDILVNNAQGMHARTPLAELTSDQVDVFWISGVKGTLWCMQAVYPIMKSKGCGRIINFVSSAGMRGEPGLGDYAATKEGIRGLTKTAAREWGRDGITVNCIAPGALSKRGQEFIQRDPAEFERRNAEKCIPRLGDPELDIAPVAVFLASDDSRFVTGQTMFADGGYCLL